MRKLILLLFCTTFIFVSCKEKIKTVHLYGELKNAPSEVAMSKETPQGCILRESEIIKLDEQNKFDITIELNEPSYYKLGKNILYLTPGDNIELFCDFKDEKLAKFSGKGAEACLYLRTRILSKGGSYLMGGSLFKGDPSLNEVKNRLDGRVKNDIAKLESLKDVSPHFKKLEKGRILFDAVNSYMGYSKYASYIKGLKKKETSDFKTKANYYFSKTINNYLKIGRDADYLHLDTYRNMLAVSVKKLGTKNVDQDILDFVKVNKLVTALSKYGLTPSVLKQRKKVEGTIKSPEYELVIESAFKKYDNLQVGKPAPKLAISNREGKGVLLSDLKGKFVVIDVYKVFQSVCTKEAPYFEKLAEKYESEDVKFISICVDADRKVWERYLNKHEKKSEQFICNSTQLKAYELCDVPRFMMIDKQGNFIDAFASFPSKPNFEKTLKKYISI